MGHLPLAVKILTGINEPQMTVYNESARGRLSYTQRAVDLFYFKKPGVGSAVGKAQRIHTEIAVVVALAAVSAVAVLRLAVLGIAQNNSVVCPLPDKPSHEPVAFFKQPAVVLQVSGAVAHSVTVFAENKGALFIFSCEEFSDILGGGIHLRDHIQHIVRSIVKLMCAFVMDRAGAVKLLYELCSLTKVFSPARLVSKRPDNNTGAVYIPADQKALTVKDSLSEQGFTGDHSYAVIAPGPFEVVIYCHTAVGLKVGLVNNIEPQLVAKPVKLGSIRVMRRSHRVDVVVLHKC